MYDLILADPPWRYDHNSTPTKRAIEKEYATMTLEDIVNLGPWVRGLANPEGSCLFMWCPIPKLKQGIATLESWGWKYTTADPWDKKHIGRGYYWRSRHEMLLFGKRGKWSPPPVDRRPHGGMYEARSTRHSRKPVCSHERIEFMYPEARKIELFARAPFREGWDVWGLETDLKILTAPVTTLTTAAETY